MEAQVKTWQGVTSSVAGFVVPWLLGVACGMVLLMSKRYAYQLDAYNAVRYQDTEGFISREIDWCGVPAVSVSHRFDSQWRE